ncbi:GNAT family N-acetyltransferase [Miniphocaeibacter massiliensis]|uniref:GNAT family N-acetyltransferase n=1 Tax=Miniphocaeibacter massiliensis TaxID=2041841 RepID=UPI000C1BD182|nr:GNAT family protein [Miniphocaeibacter massiliensis]
MIKLEYFTREDFKQLINWIESEEFLWQWSAHTFEYPLTESQLEKYIEKANYENASRMVYRAVDTETGKVVGHISFIAIDRKNNSARIGAVLVGDKNSRNTGIGKEILKEILKLAFEKYKFHRVDLGVYDFNKAAISCYEKVGFVKEGFFRDCNKMGEEYWSSWNMSILENEWCRNDNMENKSTIEK